MADVTVRPDQTSSGAGWSVTGAASHLDAIVDGDDSSYIESSPPHQTMFIARNIDPIPVPHGHRLRRMRVRARLSRDGSFPFLRAYLEWSGMVTASLRVPTTGVTEEVSAWQPLYGEDTIPTIGRGLFLRGSGSSDRLRLNEVWFEFQTIAPPELDAPTVDGAVGGVVASSNPRVRASYTAETTVRWMQVAVAAGHHADSSPDGLDLLQDLLQQQPPLTEAAVQLHTVADGPYTAWVRVAQPINSYDDLHWSDWKQVQFQVDTAPPGVPSLSVRAEFDPASGSVPLLVEDANVPDRTADTATIQRRDPDGIWRTVADNVAMDLWHVDVTDRFPPLSVEVRYRAQASRVVAGMVQTSGWSDELPVTVTSRRWHLTTADTPELDGPVTVLDQPDVRERPSTRFVPLPDGATGWVRPIVRYGQPAGLDGPLVVDAGDDDERVRLERLYQLQRPVCVRDEGGRLWWATLVGWSERRTPGNRIWTVTLDTIEVDPLDVTVR